MGNFLRNLSSLLGGHADAPREHPVATPPAPALDQTTPVESEPVASTDPAQFEQRALPLVAYGTPREATTLGKSRRSRSIGLLRNLPDSAITTRTVPTLPSVATRTPAHPIASAPLLTETERIRLQVMQTQIKLSVLHLYEGPIDGHLNAATATALRYFQTLKGIRPTGTLAAGTLAALGVPPVA